MSQTNHQETKVKALILAGGKSKRMGMDKSQISYHSQTQEVYMANMCKNLGLDTYISKFHGFETNEIENFQVIKDQFIDIGPIGAILSAFMLDASSAWLVLACDLPFLNSETITQLINNRAKEKFATAYKIKNQEFAEPLVAIYEPKIYNPLLDFKSQGFKCPRKVLMECDVVFLEVENKKWVANANTPEDKNQFMEEIKKGPNK